MSYLDTVEQALQKPHLWQVLKLLAPPPPVVYNPGKEEPL